MNDYVVEDMVKDVSRVATILRDEYHLPLKKINFIKTEHLWGRCNPITGVIEIKLIFPDGELAPSMEVWRTLAHEMAHFVHPNHKLPFWELNKKLAIRISEILGKKIRPEVAFFSDKVIC